MEVRYNLSSVKLALTNGDGENKDTESISVSGGSASSGIVGTPLRAIDEDASGHTYICEFMATDGDGATAICTASVEEKEIKEIDDYPLELAW